MQGLNELQCIILSGPGLYRISQYTRLSQSTFGVADYKRWPKDLQFAICDIQDDVRDEIMLTSL